MHTEAAIVVNEKAENIRSPSLSGGLGRVIQEIQVGHPKHEELELYRAYKVGNPLDAGMAQILSSAIQTSRVVRILDMHCNIIGDDGATAVAAMLKKNRTLTSLNVASCGFGDIGVFQLGEALKKNKSLKILNIGNHSLKKEDVQFRNTMTDRGARVMADCIKENVGLKKLMMSNLPRITNDGANSLMNAVRSGHNRTLTDLYLENSTGVTAEKRDQLRQGNSKSDKFEEGSLLTASSDEPEADARLFQH